MIQDRTVYPLSLRQLPATTPFKASCLIREEGQSDGWRHFP